VKKQTMKKIFTFIIFLLLFSFKYLVAQIDTEFWTVVPEINNVHHSASPSIAHKGAPGIFRFTTFGLASMVTLSLPADPTFTPRVFNIPPNTTVSYEFWRPDFPTGTWNHDDYCASNNGGTATAYCLATQWCTDLGKVENTLQPYNKSEKGILITATNDITCYFEIGAFYNREIISLKGKNALGTNFYIPFQTGWNNNNNYSVGSNYRDSLIYSAIQIVATEEGVTNITVTPTKKMYVVGEGVKLAGVDYHVSLNKGEVFMAVPYDPAAPVNRPYPISKFGTDKLAGTHVVADKKVAVLSTDDLNSLPSGTDYVADQLVPTSLLGSEYIVMRGVTGTDLRDKKECAYILGTVAATNIYIDGVFNRTITAGEQFMYNLTSKTTHISSNDPLKPFSVFHITTNSNDQLAGAILPPIDKCTGSFEVAINRSDRSNFYLLVMVRNGAQGGFLIDGNPPPAGWTGFTPVSINPDWQSALIDASSFINVAQPVVVSNTIDMFHIAIINGNLDNFYGYFSDFNVSSASAISADSRGNVDGGCVGDVVQLLASGGKSYHWSCATDNSFSDPDIATPTVTPPVGNHKYDVLITPTCFPPVTKTVWIAITPKTVADFDVNQLACCAKEPISFTNLSANADSYIWDFGSGDLKYDPQPTDTLFVNTTNSPITKTIGLTALSENCDDFTQKVITVNPAIVAKSSAGPKSGCQQDVTQTFIADTVGSGPFTSLYWNWGVGQELEILRSDITTLDYTHIFENLTNFDTTYYVFLVLIDSVNDCRDTAATHSVFVPGVARARFTVSDDKGCSPHTVLFENHSNGIVDYLWNFSDGSSSTTGNDTTIIYSNTTSLPKNFFVDLTITKTNDDLSTCTDTYKDTIVVYPQFTTTISASPTVGCNPLTVNFSQTTVPNVATHYYWVLGDGSTSANSTPFTKKYQHLMNTDQVYHAELVTESAFGCRDTAPPVDITVYSYIDAQFTISDSVNCSPMSVSFTNNTSASADVATSVWTDNGTSFVPSGSTFTRTFVNQTGATQQHSIKLSNTNTQGCPTEFTKVITVYPEITANFTRSDTLICHNSSITFTNTTLFTGAGTAVHSPQATFWWEFGDGSTSTSEAPSHTFKNTENNGTTPQIFTVRLTVAVNGCSQVVSKTIRVYPEVKSIMQSSSYQVCTPANVVIENHSVGANEFTWLSSDGVLDETLSNLNSVTWPADNNTLNDTIGQTVTLTAKNGSCSNVSTKRFITYPHLLPSITSDLTSGCGPLDVQFTNASTGGTLAYAWNFADGDVGSQTGTFTHRFANRTAADYLYHVTLKATNGAGCFLSTSKDITVYPEIEPGFSFTKSSECSPMPVTITNSTLNGVSFKWNFGDGTAEATTNDHLPFSHTFTNNSVDGNSISSYTIKQVVIANHTACNDSVTHVITIYPEVISNFAITENVQGCSPLFTTFQNQSKGYGIYFDWNYQDGQSVIDSVIHHHTFINRDAANKAYAVELKVTDANGCTDVSSHTATAYPLVLANFTFEHNADKCSPFPVNFTNATLNGNQFEWYFDLQTGSTSPDTTVTNKNNLSRNFDNQIANNILNYTLQLVSTDSNTHCTDKTQRQLEVYPHIVSRFTPDITEACVPNVQFTNLSSGLANYIWDFGDGQSSVETNPIHTFVNHELNQKVYTVQLIAKQNATGCVDISDTTITAYSYVKAKFGLKNVNESKSSGKSAVVGGCTPLEVMITDSSKVTGTWSWDFGDGVTSTTRQPGIRTYINTDKTYPLDNKPYTIRLRVENAEHCWDTLSQTIQVYPRSVPGFDVKAADCHPFNAAFFDKSVVDNNSQYFWNLGDGTTVAQKSFNHTFNNYSYFNDTVYTVKLVTTTQYFCSDSIQKTVTVFPKPLARFESEIERYCPPFAANLMNVSKGNNMTFYWDFDNGQTVITRDNTAQHPIFYNNTNDPKTYYIELIAESGAGCLDTIINQIHVYPNVVVGFTYDTAGCSPHLVEFKNTSNQPTEIYHWDFGNGSTSGVKNPIFRYVNTSAVTEIFQAQLIGESIYGCLDTITQPVTVYPAPVVDFAVTDPVHYYPDTAFTIQNLTNLGDWIYNWDFGDGNTSHETNPQFVYRYTGWGSNDNNNEFMIYLYANGEKCSSYDSAIVRIIPPMPEITILDEPKGCVPLTVDFSISQLYTMQYFWDFNDGFTSSDPEPQHVFDSAGFFNVKLVVTGDGGSTYAYKVITVHPLPVVDFNFAPDYVMLPDQPVQFFNLTQNGYTYQWFFDTNGIYNVNDTSTKENPSHQYLKQGEYIVRLEAKSIHGCFSEKTSDVPVIVSGEGAIEFPTAFIPSSSSPSDGSYPIPDDMNNVFHPKYHGVKEYELWIFNRWGEQVYYSDNVTVGWNGKYGNNGAEMGQDVYFWKAKGQFQNGVPFKKAGDVTLIRRK